MTNPDDDLLTTSEGVDEGSAASTVEGPRAGGEASAGVTDPDAADGSPAPPVDMESEQSRGARSASGSGQQLEAGEG